MAAPSATEKPYFTIGGMEVESFGGGTAEALNLSPHANLRLRQNNSTLAAYDWTVLHRDAQGTVRAVTDSSGARVERFVYRPYGAQISTYTGPLTGKQSKGWIGERFDAEAALQYLNARYYDPELGMFLQPDWWEVTQAGVGTKATAMLPALRYSLHKPTPPSKIPPSPPLHLPLPTLP